MTIDEFVIKTTKLRDEILNNDPPLKLASYSVLALQSKRIFSEGKNASGSTSSYNDSDPLYVNPDTSPGKKFKPQGKPKENKKGKLVSPKTRKVEGEKVKLKTRWFKSYKDYRSTIGFQSGFVNLQLSGELKSDFENPQGKEPTPTKVDVHEYIIQLNKDINQKKVEKFNEKYDNVFGLSKFEIEKFYEIATKEFIRLATELK